MRSKRGKKRVRERKGCLGLGIERCVYWPCTLLGPKMIAKIDHRVCVISVCSCLRCMEVLSEDRLKVDTAEVSTE